MTRPIEAWPEWLKRSRDRERDHQQKPLDGVENDGQNNGTEP